MNTPFRDHVLMPLCAITSIGVIGAPAVYAQEISQLQPAEQQAIYKRVLEAPNYSQLPKRITNLIKPETILGKIDVKEFGTREVLFQNQEDGLVLRFYGKDIIAERTKIAAKDAAEPRPPVDGLMKQTVKLKNGKTKTQIVPYYDIPKVVVEKMAVESPELLEYYQKMAKILNENLDDALTIVALDPEKVDKLEYTGTFGDVPVYYFADVFESEPLLTQNMDEQTRDIHKVVGLRLDSLTKIPNIFLSADVQNCTGWLFTTAYRGDITKLDSQFLHFNGYWNDMMGTEYRNDQLRNAWNYIVDNLQPNMHAFMQKKGVKPGSDVTVAIKSNKPVEQQLLTYWGTLTDNYALDFTIESQKLSSSKTPPTKTFTVEVRKNHTPVKTFVYQQQPKKSADKARTHN